MLIIDGWVAGRVRFTTRPKPIPYIYDYTQPDQHLDYYAEQHTLAYQHHHSHSHPNTHPNCHTDLNPYAGSIGYIYLPVDTPGDFTATIFGR